MTRETSARLVLDTAMDSVHGNEGVAGFTVEEWEWHPGSGWKSGDTFNNGWFPLSADPHDEGSAQFAYDESGARVVPLADPTAFLDVLQTGVKVLAGWVFEDVEQYHAAELLPVGCYVVGTAWSREELDVEFHAYHHYKCTAQRGSCAHEHEMQSSGMEIMTALGAAPERDVVQLDQGWRFTLHPVES